MFSHKPSRIRFERTLTEQLQKDIYGVPLSDLFGIVTDKSIETAQNMLVTSYMTQEWGLPENQV